VRYVLAVLIAAFILLTPAVFAGSSTVSRSVRALQASSVDEFGLQTFRNICTVTSINAAKHYWLTAAHCVNSPDLFIANRRADVVYADTEADLAVLYTEGYSLPALKLRTTRPIVGQRVVLVGHPVGLPQVQVFWGRISSLRTAVEDNVDYMLFDMTACGGNSGSVVVDAYDRIVSVLQIGFGQPCSPFSGGAPWDVVMRVVGEYFR
jgi:S1-C subfamily serine protease